MSDDMLRICFIEGCKLLALVVEFDMTQSDSKGDQRGGTEWGLLVGSCSVLYGMGMVCVVTVLVGV